MFLMNGCSKAENQKTIDTLKNEKIKLINEKTQLSKEIDSQNKLLDLRNFLDVKFYYLLFDFRHGSIDEVKKEVTSNITVYKDKLVSQSLTETYDFKVPKDTMQFRERSFTLKNPQTYEAIYEVWNYLGERLPECYVEYILKDNVWKLNSIFIDGADETRQ